MAKYSVEPNGTGWRVKQNGGVLSNHRKKSRAKSRAEREASSGDTIVIRRANGTIQNRKEVR